MVPYRILLVDDDPDTLAVMSSALRSNYETVEAVDGYDAMRKIDDFQPDAAVITEVRHGGMQGPAMMERCLTRLQRTHDGVFFVDSVHGLALKQHIAVILGGLMSVATAEVASWQHAHTSAFPGGGGERQLHGHLVIMTKPPIGQVLMPAYVRR